MNVIRTVEREKKWTMDTQIQIVRENKQIKIKNRFSQLL